MATSPQAHHRGTLTLQDRQASSVSLPTGCVGVVPTATTITEFVWYNSTHNLDCADTTDAIYNEPLCVVALDNPNPPPGYGTADQLNLTNCNARNPAEYYANLAQSTDIGEGLFDCGLGNNVWVQPFFWGDSNVDEGDDATLTWFIEYELFTVCQGYMRYNATCPLHCSRDAGGNATCTTDLPIEATLVDFTLNPYTYN